MSYEPKGESKPIEGIIEEAYNRDGDGMFFRLENYRDPFVLQVKGARIDRGERARVHLMGKDRKMIIDIDRGLEADRVRALEILDGEGNARFTYMCPLGPEKTIGKYVWERDK